MATRGPKPSTGRYATQEELEQVIEHLYWDTPAKMAQIARICRVGEARVAKLIDIIGARRAQNSTKENEA